MDTKLLLGVSACLLGENVRYDGQHKHDRYITDTLGRYVEFVAVCPEVECGLPVPREAMRLVGSPDKPRLLTIHSGVDHTDKMQSWAKKRVVELEQQELCGFIFKSGSPSSGMERVKVYNEHGMANKNGIGMFARMFMKHFPLLPVEEEGRLHDPALRENFIESIFTLKRWRDLLNSAPTSGNLVEFHTRHKLLMMAHSPKLYRSMGQLVAEAGKLPLSQILKEYENLLLTAVRKRATEQLHVNVLQHIMGYFKKILSPDEKQELLEIIDHYRNGFLPLIVPITLLQHFVRKYQVEYLSGQWYLEPHPLELKLRNHS